MTEPDPGRETRLVEIKGRQIVVRKLLDAQMLLVTRETQLLQNSNIDVKRKIQAGARIMDILESAVVQDEDKAHLMDLVVVGDLDLKDMMPIMAAFRDDAPAPKARRGRPARTAR